MILAGVGSGKTTTITRRIAYQVATGTFPAETILAIAFTRKARTEMRTRLRALAISGVNVQTIHGAAYQQLVWRGGTLPEVLDDGSKHDLMRKAIARVAPQDEWVYRKELITLIERAKGSDIAPPQFATAASSWPLPLDPDVLGRIYAEYERAKDAAGRIDFEDMQRLTLEALRSDATFAANVRRRVQAITVDEFQDVNLLQVQLIEAWLGGRDEICVVGDDYQSIYGFRGGSPRYLLEWQGRYPTAKRVTLEANYRSTPEIIAFANRLVPTLGGQAKTLRATRTSGPEPTLRQVQDESAFVVETVRRLHGAEGIAFEQIAVLVRVNRATARFEEAFAAARIPYRVEEGGFLHRTSVAAAMRLLRAEPAADLLSVVKRATETVGLRPDERNETQAAQDLRLLLDLAEEFAAANPHAEARAFVADIEQRFTPKDDAAEGRGIRLMTYHDAKGMEFDAVFLPRLIDGELPYRSGRAEAPIAEERRLLYVGITRARKHLYVTREGAASAFWRELQPPRPTIRPTPRPRAAVPVTARPHEDGIALDGSLLEVLKRWRERLYRRASFSVFQDGELRAIAETAPRDVEALGLALKSSAKAAKYGDELLSLIARKTEADGSRTRPRT